MRDFHVPGRSAAMAANGMAATSNQLATLTALDVLRSGGNAVDAAIAAVAVQCVAEPQSTGIGGDCFVLYSPQGAPPVALNGSGRAAAKADVEWYAEHGFREIPIPSPHAVTIPGAVDAWCTLNSRYGTRPLAELLEPAARAAEEGYIVGPRVAHDWHRNQAKLRDPITAKLFLPGGRPPNVGDRMRNPPLAATLRRIGREGREAFYDGPVMRDIVGRLRTLGGLHEPEDFAAQCSNWVEPISTAYRGYEVYECPPNGQGIVVLMMLRALSGYDLAGDAFTQADRLHLLAEVTKAAYWARDAYICDPEHVAVDVAGLLSEARAERVRRQIRLDQALPGPTWEDVEHEDTVYLCVVDSHGNAISFINSLFSGFGTGILAPESGVLLQNRGSGFRTIPGHPNAIAPRKRPLHTIIPAMLVKDGRAVMPFGVMGGHYQPVGQTHFLHRVLDRGLDPQQAAEQPRIFAHPRGVVEVEPTNPEPIVADLARRGHPIETTEVPLGGCQAIWIDHHRGVLIGGSESRKDGLALGY
jgi:gamma-glutamyltranspeptidase/glutathione hydrolase